VIAILLALVCGVDRWSVKTLQDNPPLSAPQPATVEQLLTLRAPKWSGRAKRRAIERTVVVVDVEVLAFKRESDGDLHAIIRGAPGKVMVAELPSPSCTGGSIYARAMARARASFERLVKARVSRMRVTGMVFFDRVHGQTGGAANGAEIHPVLKVEAIP
jgi:hypothetical protein